MKILNVLRRRKVQAATARRSAGAAEIDYRDVPEPNMKLSRALLIVLLLHVVAVSGIIAFNVIKTRQSSFVPAPSVNNGSSPSGDAVQSTPGPATSNLQPALGPKGSGPHDDAKTSHVVAKSIPLDEQKAEHAKMPAPSGKVYTVAKGDNPVKIARKLNVSYEDLITLNHIEDPRKLKVGQKLLIPKRTAKTKRTKRTE